MRVLVTRPSPDAERTAERLTRLGMQVLTAPLSTIEPLAYLPVEAPVDAIVITSANAVRALYTADLLRLPAYAVGNHTADAARAAGFTDVRAADGSAQALLDVVTTAQPQTSKLLFLAGVDRKPTLEAGLRHAGYGLQVREVYAAVVVAALPVEVVAALRGETIDAVVHYSLRSAAAFCRLVEQAGLRVALLNLAHHCISADCASPLVSGGAKTIFIAAASNEPALLATFGSPASPLA